MQDSRRWHDEWGFAILDNAFNREIIQKTARYLVLAWRGADKFHVLFASDVQGNNVRVVTAYRPSPDEWEDDMKTRRVPR